MWKLLGRIFGSKKVVDSTISGVDKLFFTREEKADYTLKFLRAYEPFKLAQRVIAFMFSGVFLFAFLISFAIFAYGVVIGNDMSTQAKDMIKLLWDVLGTPVSLIVGFYFGGGMISTLMKKHDNKKEEIIKGGGDASI